MHARERELGPRINPTARPSWAAYAWYVAIGVFNAVVYVLLGAGLVAAGVDDSAAGVIAYLPCVAVSYFGHKMKTFRSRGSHGREAPRFLALTAAGLVLGAVLPRAAIALGLPSYFGFALVTVLVPVLGYAAMRFWIFGRGPPPAPKEASRP